MKNSLFTKLSLITILIIGCQQAYADYPLSTLTLNNSDYVDHIPLHYTVTVDDKVFKGTIRPPSGKDGQGVYEVLSINKELRNNSLIKIELVSAKNSNDFCKYTLNFVNAKPPAWNLQTSSSGNFTFVAKGIGQTLCTKEPSKNLTSSASWDIPSVSILKLPIN